MKEKIKNILYYVFASIWYLISLLPFRVLYLISDLLYFPLYYFIRYRRKLVRKNLTDSFPEKNESDIIIIEKKFYSFFCDYIVETIKLFSITEKNIKKRMVFKGVNDIEKSMQNGNSCFLYLGHYCNWEWITSFPLHIQENIFCGQVYHVLHNQTVDRLFYYLRGRFSAISIPMGSILRRIAENKSMKKQMIIGFISDQAPFWNNIHYWTNFLNHDTPVFTGTERIAKKTGFSIYYTDIKRIKRGYYVCEFKKLTDSPKEYPDYEITEMYMRALENTIMKAPQYWLWTHNRWKRTREEYNERLDETTKRVRLI